MEVGLTWEHFEIHIGSRSRRMCGNKSVQGAPTSGGIGSKTCDSEFNYSSTKGILVVLIDEVV